MRFRLHYLHHDLALSEGEFVLGRSTDCQLSLDDPLVSRRHALLVVSQDAVEVEDLGSRNGVLVNGVRIAGRTALGPGDKVLIGSQEIAVLLGRDDDASQHTGGHLDKTTLPAMVALRVAGVIGSTVLPPPESTPSPPPASPEIERRAAVFRLLGGVADKALALGRAEDAERLLTTPLGEILAYSRGGSSLPVDLVDRAARFAARLATATAKGAWADYVIELYDEQERPCPAPVVDELYNALRKVSAIDLGRLRAYVAHLRERQATLGPAERFLLLRIEGLERLAALR
jgi:FHA domain